MAATKDVMTADWKGYQTVEPTALKLVVWKVVRWAELRDAPTAA